MMRTHPGTPLELLVDWIGRAATADGRRWFDEAKRGAEEGSRTLAHDISVAPRRMGRTPLPLSDGDRSAADALRPGWDATGLRIDQCARIALLLAGARSAADLADRLRMLTRTADVEERIAFYLGLPVYPAPESLRGWATEGVRSGVAPVLEAIACRNPFPGEQFEEAAWNRMILKAVFLEIDLSRVQGLDARANEPLSRALADFAEERRAAGRSVRPDVIRCMGSPDGAAASGATGGAPQSSETR